MDKIYEKPTNSEKKKRNIFYTLKREENESPRKWLMRIYRCLKKCEYSKKSLRKFLLFDRFVCGLNKLEQSKLPKQLTIKRIVEFMKKNVRIEAIMKM